MEIGTTLYVKDRRQWRAWLARHHKTAPEIWLIYYKKHSGRPRIPYSDAVEEALCYAVGSTVSRSLPRIAHVFDHESDTRCNDSVYLEHGLDAAQRLALDPL